jgi:hypothetical protein
VGGAANPARRALLLLPRPRAVDLLIPATVGFGMVAMRPWLQAKSATQTLGTLLSGWDNSAHFSMIHMIRGTGMTVDALPPPPGGGTWQFSSYPQGFHADVVTLIEVVAGPTRRDLTGELLLYSQGVALLLVVAVTMLVAGFCALPALRARPGVAMPVAGLVASVFFVGPGSDLIQDGFGNFALACVLVVAVALVGVTMPRVVAPLGLAAIGGALVGVATSWVLLLALAVPALLVVLVPFRRRRWAASPARTAVAVVLAAVVALCMLRTADVLSRVQAASPLTINTGAVPVDFGQALACALGVLGACLMAWRRRSGRATGARVAALALVPVAGAATSAGLIAAQVDAHGKVGYYGYKFMAGLLLVLLVLLVLAVVHLLPRAPRRRPSGPALVRGTAASVVVTLAFTQAFGFTFDASEIGLPPEAPGTANQAQQLRLIRQPSLTAAIAFRLERAEKLGVTIPPEAFYVDVSADRRFNSILAAQWFLSLTDTWESQSNYVAAGTRFFTSGGDAVAAARWVLVTSPSAVVVVPLESLYVVKQGLSRKDRDRVIGI